MNVLNVKKRNARDEKKKSAEESWSKNVSIGFDAKRKNAKEEKSKSALTGFAARKKSVRELLKLNANVLKLSASSELDAKRKRKEESKN